MSPTNLQEEGNTEQWNESELEAPLRLPGHDGRTIRVVSGRGYRYVLPFPYKLHEMLEEVEKAAGDFIVSWLPAGKAFRVHETDQFVKKIVPLYFKQRQYKSFQRQLHLYGFQRISEGPDKGAYYHKYFVREERHLCHQMIRRMNKAEKKAHQVKEAQQKKKKDIPEEFTPAPVAVSAPTTLDMFNDSADYERPEIRSSSVDVEIEPAASVPNCSMFQQTNDSQLQLGPQGAVSMPDIIQMANAAQGQQGDNTNIAGTINWLLSEGVSLADLGSVLDITNGQQSSQARYMQQLPMPQIAPQQPVGNSRNHPSADFAEDVISLFGKPSPPPEISFTNNQANQQQPIYNNNSRSQQAEDYSELFQSISFGGQDSFLTEAV